MKLNDSSQERLNQRCLRLEALGFQARHRDQVVVHPSAPGVVFDFSATPEEFFVAKALEVTFKEGRRMGANALREDLRELLKPENNL